jgi:hypothetical protein
MVVPEGRPVRMIDEFMSSQVIPAGLAGWGQGRTSHETLIWDSWPPLAASVAITTQPRNILVAVWIQAAGGLSSASSRSRMGSHQLSEPDLSLRGASSAPGRSTAQIVQ